MARLLVLALLALPTAGALQMAINCSSTADCADGETCVAGDSASSIQACVAGTGCGGSNSGNCPSDGTSGQLACIWQAASGCSSGTEGCTQVGDSYGIYKCLSIDRCDEYYGGSCSESCNVNGAQCNGQGSCSVTGTSSDGSPTFGCSCNSGYSGDKCESGSSTSSGSTSSTSKSSETSSGSTSSTSGSTGSVSSASGSTSSVSSASGSTGSLASSSGSTSSSSVSRSGSSSSNSSSSSSNSSNSSRNSASADSAANNNTSADPTSTSGSVASESSSGGTSSAVFIIIGVLAACIIIGALAFAMYSRKKKREQEAEAGGFGGAAAFGATARLGNDSELATGTGADTPKSSIVTM